MKDPKDKIIEILTRALSFYADPFTYYAIGFFPDPPCGEFIRDGSDTLEGYKPGKLAREELEKAIMVGWEEDEPEVIAAFYDYMGENTR